MQKLRARINKAEGIVLYAGFLLSVIFICLIPYIGYLEYEGLIGYFIGFVYFKASISSYFKLSAKSKAVLFFLNLKLVILATLVYILHRVNISAVHVIVGILTSQIIAIVTLLFTLHKAFNYKVAVQNNSELNH